MSKLPEHPKLVGRKAQRLQADRGYHTKPETPQERRERIRKIREGR